MSARIKQSDIADILADARADSQHLTAEELLWVRLAIKKEAQSILFRQAIIEKTTAALLWSAIASLGYVVLALISTYLEAHGWKIK